MKRSRLTFILLIVVFQPWLARAQAFKKVSPDAVFGFASDLSDPSLLSTLELQLRYFEGGSVPDAFLNWDGKRISRDLVVKGLKRMVHILKKSDSPKIAEAAIRKDFEFHQVRADVLFTAYFAPEYEARRNKEGQFLWPIYRNPGQRVTFTRAQINAGALAGRNLEIAYMDRIDRFLLQVQGSGTLKLDNATLGVSFDGHNGYPYRGIGTIMKAEGVSINIIPWIDGFRDYFEKNPLKMDHFFHQQERFIFFKENTGKALGMAGLEAGIEGYELTGMRSCATNSASYPIGAILLSQFRHPEEDPSGGLSIGPRKSRILVNQDTGGPLRTVDHVDIFFGRGTRAGRLASMVNERGPLFILLPREDATRK